MTRAAARCLALAWAAFGAAATGCVTYDSVGDPPPDMDPDLERPLSCFLPSPCDAGETCGELVYVHTPTALATRSALLPLDDASGQDCPASDSSVCALELRVWELPRFATDDRPETLSARDDVTTSLDDCGRYRVGTVDEAVLVEAGGQEYALTIERLGATTGLVPLELVTDDWATAAGVPLLESGLVAMPVLPLEPNDGAAARYLPQLTGSGETAGLVFLAYDAGVDRWDARDIDTPSPDGGVVIATGSPGVYRRRFLDRATGDVLCPAGGLPSLVALVEGRVFLEPFETGRTLEPCID